MTPAQAGCFLMGLRMKGETPLEMAHAVGIALGRANRVEGLEGDCIDVVGTGGDGRNSFNCSTATALTLAGMGYRVVKHGNRAVSSSCGSADALEGLGFPLDVAPEDVRRLLDERNFAFLFAPNFHPAFRNVGPIRRELGIRTLFNLLGPLINPARPTHILLGVARPELVELLAETLRQSHIRKAAVVYGAGGYDEVTPLGPTKMMIVHNGNLTPMSLDPLGLRHPALQSGGTGRSFQVGSRGCAEEHPGGERPACHDGYGDSECGGSHVPAGGAHGPVRLHGESAGSRLRRHRKENASCCLTGSGKPRRRK